MSSLHFDSHSSTLDATHTRRRILRSFAKVVLVIFWKQRLNAILKLKNNESDLAGSGPTPTPPLIRTYSWNTVFSAGLTKPLLV